MRRGRVSAIGDRRREDRLDRIGPAPSSPRPADGGDAAGIAALHARAWAETYGDLPPFAAIVGRTFEDRVAVWTRRLRAPPPDGAVFVVDDDDDGIVGFAASEPAWSVAGFADRELSSLYVATRHQGRGIGGALLDAVRTGAAATGGRRLGLWVAARNLGALAFYCATGATAASARCEVETDPETRELGLVYALTRRAGG